MTDYVFNADYSVYDTRDGRILRTISCAIEDRDLQILNPNEAILDGKFDDDVYYVEDGVPVLQETYDPSWGTTVNLTVDEEWVIPNVSGYGTLVVEGTLYVLEDERNVILSFDSPGSYEVRMDLTQYLPYTFTVEVV